ncbi:MAG: hypothetical protein PVI78_00295 [Anaerolineales bacterium]
MATKSLQACVMQEMAFARRARADGNEGRARVCARRAAGWALSVYYERRTGTKASSSALSLLHWLQNEEALSEEIRKAAQRLTTRVTANFKLPFEDDPLADAQRIIDFVTG